MRMNILSSVLTVLAVSCSIVQANPIHGLNGSDSAGTATINWWESSDLLNPAKKHLGANLVSTYPIDWDQGELHSRLIDNKDQLSVSLVITGDAEAQADLVPDVTKTLCGASDSSEFNLKQTNSFRIDGGKTCSFMLATIDISNLEVSDANAEVMVYPVPKSMHYMYMAAYEWTLYSPTGDSLAAYDGLQTSLVVPEPMSFVGLTNLFLLRRRR